MLNLLVIRSSNIERAKIFYEALGLVFEAHQHGNGAPHFAAEEHGLVFEIYPLLKGKSTSATRFGFRVNAVEETIANLIHAGGEVIASPQPSPWGIRAVVKDPDGHRVELVEYEDCDELV
ncbi:MAG: VOC family protein [Cyanobacteriota bacterium]|nr:VOC family protein [Cyanobacteriota bacterium]